MTTHLFLVYFLLLLHKVPSENLRTNIPTPVPKFPPGSPNANIRLAVKAYLKEGDYSKYGPIDKWDTSEVSDMSKLFLDEDIYYKESGTFDNFSADLSLWDVSKVTDMNQMFSWCTSFSSDLSQWDVSQVTDMYSMFGDNHVFSSDLSQWNVSKVTDMYGMFSENHVFMSDLSQWNVSNVMDMSGMFWSAHSFSSDLSEWNVSKVTDMRWMFKNAFTFNCDLNNWNVQNVSDMSWMFYDATSFQSNVSSWNVSQVTTMHRMFHKATSFNSNIRNWDTSNVVSMYEIFQDTSSFNRKLCWDMSQVKYQQNMFQNSKGKLLRFPQCKSWNTTNNNPTEDSTSSSGIQNDILRLAVKDYLKLGDESPYGPISEWDTSKVTNMAYLFDYEELSRSFFSTYKLEKLKTFTADLSKWNVSKVTTMRSMFAYTISFNSNISQWDVGNVKDMSYMFQNCEKFNQDMSTWNVGEVKTMRGMFQYANSFNKVISSWNVSKVEDMGYMFTDASSFNINISSWNVSKVKDMGGMFQHADSFDYDISNWDVDNVRTMKYMFYGSTSFQQKLCFDISKVSNLDTMFHGSRGSLLTYPECKREDPVLILSNFSNSKEKWCLIPKKNIVSNGTPLVISNCKLKNSHHWIFDYLGKIRNYENKDFCISQSSSDIVLKNCDNASHESSTWIYSFNEKRILKLSNAQVGFSVRPSTPSKISSVKIFQYDNRPATLGEAWDLEHESGELKWVPWHENFRIMSRLGNGSEWCLYAKNNNIQTGIKIVIGKCKKWKGYQWTIDPEGKIHNVENPSLCISFENKRIELSDCLDHNNSQKWAYNVMDKRIFPIIKYKMSLTVENSIPSKNEFVRLLSLPPNGSKESMEWNIDTIV